MLQLHNRQIGNAAMQKTHGVAGQIFGSVAFSAQEMGFYAYFPEIAPSLRVPDRLHTTNC